MKLSEIYLILVPDPHEPLHLPQLPHEDQPQACNKMCKFFRLSLNISEITYNSTWFKKYEF